MKKIKDISIKTKNILVIILILSVSMIGIMTYLGIEFIKQYKSNLVSKVNSVISVVGNNSIVSLEFEHIEQAQSIIESLGKVEELREAAIITPDGEIFVRYSVSGERSLITIDSDYPKPTFTDDYLFIQYDIYGGDEYYGKIIAVATLAAMEEEIRMYVFISAFIGSMVLLLASFIGYRLSESIISPITILSETAAKISMKADYSIRVKKTRDDESGILYDSFNSMLEALSAKDREIRILNENLGQKVEKRTADLERAKVNAEIANKAKSAFLANMSHEIRTPLNSVLGFTQILDAMVEDETQRSYLNSIRASGKTLLTLISDILDLSKIESGTMTLHPSPVYLQELIDDVIQMYYLTLSEKKLALNKNISTDLPQALMIDEVRMRQILINLIGNAVKFTEKGYIKVSLEVKDYHHAAGSVDLLLTVADTGIGISKHSHNAVFDAFRQVEDNSTKKYEGTGLGLSITKRLVEMMKGKISLDSQFGYGSTFEVFLPQIKIATNDSNLVREEVKQYDAKGTVKDISFNGEKILIVDDSGLNRKLLIGMFKNQNLTIFEAENGKDAIAKIHDIKPDIVLMDLRMPIMNGYEAAREIRKLDGFAQLPLLAMTASAFKDEEQAILAAGFDDIIIKPIKIYDLQSRVAFYLTGGNQNASEIKDNSSDKLANEDPIIPAEILEELKSKFLSQWSEAISRQEIDLIIQFAKDLEGYNSKHLIPQITRYCNQVLQYCESFEIDNLNKTLSKFTTIINKE